MDAAGLLRITLNASIGLAVAAPFIILSLCAFRLLGNIFRSIREQ